MSRMNPAFNRRAWLGRVMGAGALLSLSACGFALRKPPRLAVQRLHVDANAQSPLGQAVIRYLRGIDDLEVTTDARARASAQAVLILAPELPIKRIESRTASGAVREFTLELSVSFRMVNAKGIELLPNTTLSQRRNISFEETAVLSKESEEQLLFAEMREDLIQQLLRRVASVRVR
jgi:LPS-assembly lipoprotein